MSRIRIEQKSIIKAGTQCIVNAANTHLMGGSGVCGAIFQAAGWNQLQSACDAIGHCDTGSAVITPAFNLNAEYIIHAVGPVWYGGKKKEPQKLYGCYKASLNLAKEYGCHSIAFPLISAGIFGYPKDQAWRKALQACNDFIDDNPDYYMDILFTIPDPQILQMGLAELKAQAKNADVQQEKKVWNETTDDDLLSSLNRKALKTAIESVKTVGKIQWKGGKGSDGIIQKPFPEYPDEIWASFSIFEQDTDYSDNYEKYCKGVLPTDMNAHQIRTMLTFIERGERFYDGHVQRYLENNILLKLLLRLDDLVLVYDQKYGYMEELNYL